MKQRVVGIILLLAGLFLLTATFLYKHREDVAIDNLIMTQGGSCYLADGTCLHDDRDWTLYIISWAVAGSLVLFSLYLLFVDKTLVSFTKHQEAFVKRVEEATQKDQFQAYLAGFPPEERRVILAIHEQDGITQATLRFRVAMSKAALSQMLDKLGRQGVITKTPAGKTNKLYLRTRF
jgi:DNA-binding MarR family transcriptional regulator